MARQLRHHDAGGWYHITTRGMGVQAVAKACERMGEKLKTDKRLRRELARACRAIEEGKRANI